MKKLVLPGSGDGVNSGAEDDGLEFELELEDVANGSDSELVGSSAYEASAVLLMSR